jgi:uridine kinase
MEKLKNGRAVNIPNYDFQNHKRIGPGWEVFGI